MWIRQLPNARVGLIGLGAGTLANYAEPGQHYRFYEINPAVERLARRHFWSLADCRGEVEVVLGDARLSLERESPNRFSALVLDAFSGDAIPTHLLTAEAFAIYRKHLTRDGVIAVHISNGYLNLQPVVQGVAQAYDFGMVRISTRGDDSKTTYHADWMLLSQDARFLLAQAGAGQPETASARSILWTDDFSDLFSILK
jgi:spermidine synthase